MPSNGEANAALERLIADWVGVPLRSVRLTAGGKSRVKSLAIDGDCANIIALITEKLKPEPA